MKVYLAGYIQGTKLDECLAWRRKIREHFDHNTKWQGEISFLDPLNGKNFGSITPDGLKSDIPGKALVHRDHKHVMESDLLIANMSTFGETSRPITGTIYELAWAWQAEKPTIVITEEDNYKCHPFIIDTASIIVSSVEELLEKKYINYFYKGGVSAVY